MNGLDKFIGSESNLSIYVFLFIILFNFVYIVLLVYYF